MLLHKYSGYLTNLRKEFLKKRKKGKLPKDARTALLDWWTTHYRWPYPTVIEFASNLMDASIFSAFHSSAFIFLTIFMQLCYETFLL